MNSPYMGNFEVTQEYKGDAHDGLDLVGIDSKKIHATANGEVVFAGWENPNDVTQGFGKYVVIRGAMGYYYHYGHLSQIDVKCGDIVHCTDVIGVEGNTGNSTGSHCHYCIRRSMQHGDHVNVCAVSGIPNKLGIYNDGYIPPAQQSTQKVINAIIEIDEHKYSGVLTEI